MCATVFPTAQWEYATPESQGIPSKAIENMLRQIVAERKDIHSMLLIRHGRLVFEHYFAPYTASTPHSMYSCSKTFTSMLTGIAQDKGLLSVEDRVLNYFPEFESAAKNPLVDHMRIKHLLMMGSGHGQDTFGNMMNAEDGNWPRVFFEQPVDHEPGSFFLYNTGATYMLSNILTRVTGKSALELANEWLFPALGISGATWDADPQGISMGGTGLHIRPLDMARFGLMLLHYGAWEDRQIVSSAYVHEASTKQIDNRNPNDPHQDPNWASGYCYQIWRCCFPAFRADGMGGQFIVMMPDYNAVAVFTSALGNDIGYPLDLLKTFFVPAMTPDALPEDEDAQAALNALAASLAMPEALPMPEDAKRLPWGKKLVLNQPATTYPITAISLGEEQIVLEGDAPARVPVAWNAPVMQQMTVPGRRGGTRQAAVATRLSYEQDALFVRINVVTEPATWLLKIGFAPDGSSAHLTMTHTLGPVFETDCILQ